MRILIHAVAAKSGGTETQVRNLVGELARAGAEHHFLLCVPPRLAAEMAGKWPNVTVLETEIGFKSKWRRLLWDQWTFRRLARGVDRIFLISDFGLLFPPHPQVLTLQNALLFSPSYAEKILPSKGLFQRLELLLRRWLISLVVKQSAVVTTASQSMLDDVRRFIPIPAGKVAVNPFGVPKWKFAPALRPAPGGALRLLHVSEYGDYKNLAVLLKAIPLIKNTGVSDFYLTTTADPSQFPELELATRETDRALLADPLVAPHVKSIGRVPYAHIHRLYQEHDLFLFPSMAAKSFGHPLVEAMASGLPIVASDIPICREICGEAALYFDPWDPQDLARKIQMLWNDPPLRTRLGELGPARAKFRFSWRDHATRLVEILETAGREVPPAGTLLLKLATSTNGSGRQIAGLSARQPPPDWNALYELANRHQMVGILAPRLLKELDGALPLEARSRWMDRWRALAIQDLAQKAALQEILVAAQGRGIRPMLLKGFAVQRQAYPEEAARGAFDIDLLVRPPDLPGMVLCLEESGFTFIGKDPQGRPVRWRALLKRTHEAPFHRAVDGVSVDLHASLCSPLEERLIGLKLRDQLWENPRRIPLGQRDCAMPGREEEILFLCLHMLKAGPFVLRNLSDIVRLLRITPPVDWSRLLRLAQNTGTGTFAHYAFEMATEISPGAVPDSIRARLARFAGPRRLFASSLRLDRLLQTHGQDWPNLALRWRGVFFARRPWVWLPYQLALLGKAALRRMGLC